MPTLTVITLLFLSAFVTLALWGLSTAGKRRAAQIEADDLEAARLRLVAAGEDPDAVHDCNTHEPYAHTTWHTGTVYASAAAAEPVAEDVAAHVEEGAGSLTSLAATASDTREMRTGAEARHLAEVYDAAHDEDIRRDLSAAFASHEGDNADVWAVIDAWVERYHGETHYATCVHCAETLHVQSDEYAQIVTRVEGEHTGEISKADIEALYALQGATT